MEPHISPAIRSVPPQQIVKASDKARKNQSIMKLLQAESRANPEVDLEAACLRISKEETAKPLPPPGPPPHKRKKKMPPKQMKFGETVIALAKDAEIIFPLSVSASELLAEHADPKLENPAESLLASLKRLISKSKSVWECDVKGAVLKCNDEIAIKILYRKHDFTEYTTMQYLALNSPETPAPKPHGLVKMSQFQVMFMTYFPSINLEEAWPTLSHDNKLSIQRNLDDIFSHLRKLKQPAGQPLGGVNGEGVKDRYMHDKPRGQQVNSNSGFEDYLFWVAKWPPSPAFTKFLRSFFPPTSEGSVFTHGDLRPANIMVQEDASGMFIVSGIIDWETSGFYPEYYESTSLLYLFHRNDENDWYEYLPSCISPANFPERWLVGRIWDMSIGFSAVTVEEYRTDVGNDKPVLQSWLP